MAKIYMRRQDADSIVSAAERMARRMNGRFEVDEERIEIVEDEVETEEAEDKTIPLQA